tara:strand:- start:1089 stop:1895 length:807 start_codon:yes stop_codon:yes gene_type:complete
MLKRHQTNLNLKLTETRYGKFIIPADDPTIGRSMDEYGEYCDAEIDLLKKLVKPDSWFIDIGANIGTHTVPLSYECERVLAFEPDPENYDILGKNVAGLCSWKNNVTVTKLALGSEAKDVTTKFDFGKTTIVEGTGIKMAPYDLLGIPKTSVVKIDVEGNELDVLVGMRSTLTSQKPEILVEMQDETMYSKTYDFFKSIKYNMYWFPVRTFNPVNQKGKKEDIFGDKHGVINWLASADLLKTNLNPVVDREDTVQRMVYRSRENVGND